MHEWLIEALVLDKLGLLENEVGCGRGYYGRRALALLRMVRQEQPELQTIEELAAEVKSRGFVAGPSDAPQSQTVVKLDEIITAEDLLAEPEPKDSDR